MERMISGEDVINDSVLSIKDVNPLLGLTNYTAGLGFERYVRVAADHKPQDGEMQLGMFDRNQPLMWVPLSIVYENVDQRQGFMDFERMRQSLALTLGRLPIMSGQLSKDQVREKIVIKEGAWFCEEKTDLDFDSIKSNLSYEHLPSQVRFRAAIHAMQKNIDPPVFSAKMTRFPCGSVILTLLYHHLVVDGRSMSDFVHAWSLIARGKEPSLVDSRLNPPVLPQSLALQKTKSELGYVPNSSTEKIMCRIEIPESKLASFKSESKEYVSIDDIFNAIVWRAITQSRPETNSTHHRRSTDIRRHIAPAQDTHAFGNFFENYPAGPFSTKTLNSMSIIETALALRTSFNNIDKDYVTSLQAFLAHLKENIELLEDFVPSVDIVSTCHARFYQDLDFDTALPIFTTVELFVEGMLLTMAPFNTCYLAYITLQVDHALKFMENSEARSIGLVITPMKFAVSDRN